MQEMLKQLEEYGKYVEITGFRNIKITCAKDFAHSLASNMAEGIAVQLFEADLIAGWQHLYFAVLNALLAFKTNRNLSRSLPVETALYASAQRQIRRAIDKIGLKPLSKNAAVILIGENPDSLKISLAIISKKLDRNPDETVLKLSKPKIQNIKREFEISKSELQFSTLAGDREQALTDLIIERVALLSTRL